MKPLRLIAILALGTALHAQAGEVSSPDGSICVNFELRGTVPTYSVTYQGKPIILPAAWAMTLTKKLTC